MTFAASDRRSSADRALYLLLVAFLLGWYLLPSTRRLDNLPHNLLFWLGLLPAFLVLRLPELWRLPRREPVLALAAAAIGWMTVSIAWSRPPFELGLGRCLLDGLSTLVFVVACVHLLDRDRAAHLERILAAAGGLLALASLLRFAAGHSSAGGRLAHAVNFEHPNLLGHSLGLAALLALRLGLERTRRRGERLAWGGAVLVSVAAIVLTFGRTPLVAVTVAGLTVLTLDRRPRTALAVAVLLLLAAGGLAHARPELASSYVKRGDAGRDVIWTTLAQRTADRPLLGAGLRASDDVEFAPGSGDFPKGATLPHAHSLVVGTYYRGGAIGLGLFLALAVAAFAAAIRSVRRGGPGRALPLLVFGAMCLIPDGHRLVSNPHLSSWLLLWLPIALAVREARAVADRPEPAPDPGSERRLAELLAAGPPRWLLVVLVAALVAQRLLHFGPDLDEPHVWRQSDTAHYARDLAERGFDLLHPAVCWMGPHRTLVLECPLPEAVMAVGYRLLGEDHRVARAVTLAFFLLSAWFFERFVAEILGAGIARWATLAYLAMPLGLFYSRAVHIDPAALALAHGMAWCWARAANRGARSWLVAGVALAVPAVLVKAPYAATMLAPLAVVALRSPHLRRLAPLLPLLLLPVAAFVAWQGHAQAVNAAAPDWGFIPTYRRFTDNAHWYFGGWRMRLNLELWATIAGRLLTDVVGVLGLLPAVVGALLAFSRRRLWPLAAWLAGLGLYVLVFFNLNEKHDYYQLPFLGPLAVCLVLGLGWLAGLFLRSGRARLTVVSVLLVACAATWVVHAERTYYRVPRKYLEAAQLVCDSTPDDALVVVSFGGLDPRCPNILYPARRDGWSIPDRDLRPELVERLRAQGASHLMVAWTLPPSEALEAYLEPFPVVAEGRAGDVRVQVFRLDPQNPEVSGRR